MNERHEGKHLRRQEAKKRWKTILAVFLSVVLVMQSSNIQAFADVLASGGSEGRDEVVMDPAAEDTGTQGEVTTPEETDTADEQASSQDDAEQTVAETEENPVETTAQDTEATTPDGQSNQAQSEQAPAEETDTTVTLNVEVSAATLKYSAQDGTEKSVTSETDPKSVDVSNTLDFTFTVAPDDGQRVSSVAYAGAELTANDSGEYTIAASDLTDGEKIVVTTEAVPTEEPAEDATPVESEETTEPEFDAEKSVAPEDEAKVEETVDEATADVANKLEAANNALANSIMLLNTGLPVNVTIRYYDEQNNVTEAKDGTITSGVINEDNVPKQEGYYYLDATISEDNIPIAYVEAHEDGSVYYALEKNAATGILLDEGERIYLNYKALGNSIPVDYTTSGDAGVNGNEVIGFPETAEKGGNLGFQVALARGYDSVVTVNGQTYEAATEASGANTYSIAVPNDAQNMTVNVEFVKTATVSFDPGVFNDPDYVYLNGRFTYTNGSGQVKTEQVGQDGASFDFSFTTNGAWQLDSLQVNGIYLNVPHTRNRGASATTVLYQDAANPCVATLSVMGRNGNNVSYRLSITGAKEDLTITEGNLNGVGWHEVVPSATNGIEFRIRLASMGN